MRTRFLMVLSCALLVSCNPRKHYNKIIQDLGFIAYQTPLDTVGTGTIVKGKPKDLIVFTRPERCLPDILSDGSLTKLRYQAETDLPQSIREAKFAFTADLEFFGSTGNPLFSVNSNVKFVKNVEAKFSDARVEFIDEIVFWDLYENRMGEDCKAALLKNPVFWKALRVGKMEFVFKNEAGGEVKLSAPMIKDIVKIEAGVNWSIKDEFRLVIETPKYIGFLAAQVTEEAVRERSLGKFSNSVDGKGNYVWKILGRKSDVLPLRNVRPMY